METWTEMVKGESFCVRDENDEPFKGDDGHPYEIIIAKESDGSISTTIHDLETDQYDIIGLDDYKAEAAKRWGH